MEANKDTPAVELIREEQVRLAMDMMHRTFVHHIFWFKEVEHQMGFEKALEIMDAVYDKSACSEVMCNIFDQLNYYLED